MGVAVLDAEVFLDEQTYPPERPQIGVVSGGHRPGQQGFAQRFALLARHEARTPPLLISRRPSMPFSCNTPSQRYTVCRGAPTLAATSTGFLPLSSSRPARTRRLAASSIFATMTPPRCNPDIDITHQREKGCLRLRNSQ
jgi:hypothetical protein